jgi:CheY-like chemotaxis protein
MNILFVDDMPEIKVQPSIKYLQRRKVDFTYQIVKSSREAIKCLNEHSNEIDLAIVDLGLPFYENGEEYDEREGLEIVLLMLQNDKFKNIKIIINSTTEIPKDESLFLKSCKEKGRVIEHVKPLNGEWLKEFLELYNLI